MSEEHARPEQPDQDDVGCSGHAELVNGLDGVLDIRGPLAAAINPVHGTEPCTDPHCTIPRPHGHRCPRCGPGTFDIIAGLDG